MRVSTMKTTRISVLIFLIYVSAVSCFPSKPLNERSTELAWQAWLLIDENQNKHQDQDGVLRRRITPKSVFIAPTFSPESWPECSEGYQSDPMGHCIKIIMLNQEMHLDFLLKKLNEKFGDIEDYDSQDDYTTTGPFQINIPLDGTIEEEGDTDVAIVVAPTNGHFLNRTKNKFNDTLNQEGINVQRIAGILGVKKDQMETTTMVENSSPTSDGTTSDDAGTTTPKAETVTPELNALFFLNSGDHIDVQNLPQADDANTLIHTLSTGVIPDSTESNDGSIRVTSEVKREVVLESKLSKTASGLKSGIVIDYISTTPKNMVPEQTDEVLLETSTQIFPESTGYVKHITFPLTTNVETTTYATTTNTAENTSNPDVETSNITTDKLSTFTETTTGIVQTTETFKDENKVTETPKIIIDVIESNGNSGTIRFPNESPEASHLVRFPTNDQPHQPHSSAGPEEDATKKLGLLFNEYLHKKDDDLTNVQRQVFKNHQGSTNTHVDLTHALYQQFNIHRSEHTSNNHRNRDKHSDLFHLPLKWTDSVQTPLVLRFSRKHDFIDTQQFKGPNFYREVNPGLFGFAHRTRTLR